jgi:hypothetical protein
LYPFTLKDFLRELMNVMRCAILKKILIYIYMYTRAETHTHTQEKMLISLNTQRTPAKEHKTV